jgi:Phage tail sheath protein FI
MSPTPTHPGIYVDEIPSGVRTITGVPTSICVFVGRTLHGPLATEADGPVAVWSFADFEREFGGLDAVCPMGYAVRDFFANGGGYAVIARLRHVPDESQGCGEAVIAEKDGPSLTDADYLGDASRGTGLHALRRLGLFNLLCVPPDAMGGDTSSVVYQAALALCVERRAMLLVDPPTLSEDAKDIAEYGGKALIALGLEGTAARNAALYFPRLLQPHPSIPGQLAAFAPCGAVAGVMARTDATRGVWKAPAGTQATLNGVADLAVPVSDEENSVLNPIAINALRKFPTAGKVIWGARTMRGADRWGDEYKYVPVRRLALHIEESLLRGIAWAAFEPNDEPLWAQLRLNVGAFLQGLFRQGAFQGVTPRDAWFVKCDTQTTTQADIERGVCNIHVGFAPLKPAEFVMLRLAQKME